MITTRIQRIIFGGTSHLTEWFPVFGARLLDWMLRPVVGSPVVSGFMARRNRKTIKRTKRFRRFLVIPDIHVGDAVMTQSSLTAIRDFFPDAEIDYVINKTVAPLIIGNPDATRVMPIFSGGLFPAASDVEALREIVRKGGYDFCLGYGPFMNEKKMMGPDQTFISFLTHASAILHNENDTSQINHFSYQGYHFVRDLLSAVAKPVREDNFRGVRTTYSDQAIEGALSFAADAGLTGRSPVIMFNPDSACRFNMMPFESQAALLGRLANETTADTTILLGEGHTAAGIGNRLAEALSRPLRSKVCIIPQTMSLEAYSALVDFSDVFVTSDTGPLHIGASRRYSRSGCYQFRNRTAVLSFFGTTMPRMSGYDSRQPGYLPANQNAPSWCYLADSPCRNITCMNKMFKTCSSVRCFDRVDVAGLAALVVSHLRGLGKKAPSYQPLWGEQPRPVQTEALIT